MITEKVTSFIPDAIREAGNTIAAAIQGGSGGSSVEWSQIVTTGTKIAIITINGQPTEVYAPTGGGGGSSVSWNEIQTTGTKIAEITIDGTTYDVYAPNVSVSASDVSYDNMVSGLTADDVQEAIDEIDSNLDTLSGTVSGHTTDIGNLQTAVGSKAGQSMIAPVETSTTASQAYAIGEQFILNGTLYTATAAITAGGTIVIDGNCTASDTVTEQMDFKYVAMQTGNTVIPLPTDWKELNVYVIAKTSTTEIPRRVLTLNTNRHFANTLNQTYYARSGVYQDNATYYAVAVEFTTTTVKLNGVTISGTDRTSVSDIYVYYR